MNLYTFETQNRTVRLTTSKVNRMFDNELYTASTLKRSKYILDTVLTRNRVEITFPGDDQFARQFIHPNLDFLNVTIATLTGVTFYRGRLITVDYRQNMIVMRFEPTIKLARKTLGERRIYQIHCPYVVYGDNCGANRVRTDVTVTRVIDDYKVDVRFDTGDPRNFARMPFDQRFNVMPTSHRPPKQVNVGRLSGGLLSVGDPGDDDYKQWWITKVEQAALDGQFVDLVLQLSRPYELAVGDVVQVSFGCKQTTSDCRDTHNNIINYGGFPAMKKISPFVGGLKG